MAAALVGLAGVLVGSGATLLTTWIAARSTDRQARESRAEDRQDQSRQLAASAYVEALEAVAWLSMMHVEDSVDPLFAAEYEPKTVSAVGALHAARRDLMQVSALGGSHELAAVVPDVVTALATLGDAWERAQSYRRHILAGHKSPIAYDEWFDREAARLEAARERLCGHKTDLPSREVDSGLVTPESLLGRLREATSRT